MSRRRLPRPTRKAVSLVVAAALLFGVAANSQAGWVFVLAAAVFGVVAAGAMLPSLALRGLEVTRRAPPSCRAQEPVSVFLEIHNSTASPRTLIEGTDAFLGSTSFLIERIPPKNSTKVRYEVEATRRGVYQGGEVVLSTGAPFGIRTARRRRTVVSPITVHPRWVSIPSFPLLESASTPHEVLHERRRGSGMEFYGIREYRPGDSLRHVHWRSTARTGRLYVREFEEQFASRLGILIDASEKVGREPHTTFEDAVACAASLVIYALQAGHPAQIFCDSRGGTRHLFEPGRVEALDWLAGIEADGRRGLARVAADMAGEIQRRSTNVLIFAATKRNAAEAPEAAAILQGLSSRVIAVAVSAHSYSGRSTASFRSPVEPLRGVDGSALQKRDGRVLDPAEEDALAERLAEQHVIVYRVGKGQDLDQCLREPSRV